MTTFENNSWKVTINTEETPENPRKEFDNIAKMVCFHNRYSLGDSTNYSSRDYDSFKELSRAIIKNEKPAVMLPIYMYDHSGITISTSPFSCKWDSGQIGFAYITKADLLAEFGGKICTKKLKEKAIELINIEISLYDSYLSGDVYEISYVDKSDGSEDYCSNMFGMDFWNNGMYDFLPTDCVNSLREVLTTAFGEQKKS